MKNNYVWGAVLALVCCQWTVAQEGADAEIAELKRQIGVRDQVIRNLIERIEALERAVQTLQGNAPTQATASPPTTPSPTAIVPPSDDAERISLAFERTLIDRGALTLQQWTWEVDSGLTYGHASSEALTIDGFTVYPVLVVGDIVSERVRRDSFGAAVTLRGGFPWQLQADVRVPYSYETSSRVSAAGEESTLSGHGLGDIELGVSRPLWHADSGSLDLLGALRWKSTTGRDPFDLGSGDIPFGTGFDALSASATLVAAQDPMVFFGTLTYTYNWPERKDDLEIDPGVSYGLQLGTALAVNLDTSLSFAYQQQYNTETRVNDVALPGSYVNTGSLSISLSHALRSGWTFDTGVVIGLTEDSPDLQLTFSMPFRRSSR